VYQNFSKIKAMKAVICLFLSFSLAGCVQSQSNATTAKADTSLQALGNDIQTRFEVPPNFERVQVPDGSFGAYLRALPLKPVGAKVKLFNGSEKQNDVYDAVIDLDIGHKDLHQCADAVMRLRAEYLWKKGAYDKIHFNFTNGMRVNYSEWMKGRRIVVNKSQTKTYWNHRHHPSNTYADFWDYLETIFMYAGTSSLSKELIPIKMNQMSIGDVLIRGGFPGHAVIVLDMAENPATGERIFLLGQSYMPAQELQVLKNNYDRDISPWYHLNNQTIYTPEWTFYPSNLMRFGE